MYQRNAQGLDNTAWACVPGQQGEYLVEALVRPAERRLDQFQFPRTRQRGMGLCELGQRGEQLFKALAIMAERRLDQLNSQEVAHTA